MLAADLVTLSRQGRRILDRFSVQVGASDVVALIGSNGARKSTLPEVLPGEIKPIIRQWPSLPLFWRLPAPTPGLIVRSVFEHHAGTEPHA